MKETFSKEVSKSLTKIFHLDPNESAEDVMKGALATQALCKKLEHDDPMRFKWAIGLVLAMGPMMETLRKSEGPVRDAGILTTASCIITAIDMYEELKRTYGVSA